MKVGEGKNPAPSGGPNPAADLQKGIQTFRQCLREHEKAMTSEEKGNSQRRMQSTMSIMDFAAQGMKKETRVQEQKVRKDYDVFQQNPSKDNASILEHDLNTLNESLKH